MTRNLLSFLALNLLFNAINVLSSNNTNQCEEGWETLGYEKCYLIQSGSNAKKWGEAKSFCEEQEAELFFPVSGEEEADLWNLYLTKPDAKTLTRLWINAVALDSSNSLKYTTSNGDELGYTNWRSDKITPNNANGFAWIGPLKRGSLDQPIFWEDAPSQNYLFDFACQKESNEKTNHLENDKDACFQDEVLFVESSVTVESIDECRVLCQKIQACQFFTWNEFTKGCGIRKFTPSNYVKAKGQSTASRTGEVLQDFVLVGKAILIEDKANCLEACRFDDKCLSCTYNDDTSENPNICVFNYGPKERTLTVPDSGISSAMRNC